MKIFKYLITVYLSVFILASCGDDISTLKIDDTETKKEKTISPLPSQNGIVVNSGGNIIKSENYKFNFVVGMNKTITATNKSLTNKKYSFKFINENNIIEENTKRKYSFKFTK